jgi:hypothetical protein
MEKLEGGNRRLKKRWNPKEWKPEYEMVVALSCTGLSHSVIGERFGYTPVHIGNIVNCEYGKALRKIILDKLRNDVSLATPDLIKDTQTKALERISAVLNNDTLAANSPFAIFDRSLKWLSETNGIGNDDSDERSSNLGNSRIVNNNQTNIAIGTDALKVLQAGTQKALEVRQTYQEVKPLGIGTGTEAENKAKQQELLKLKAENASPLDVSSQIKQLERQMAAEGLSKVSGQK